MQDNWMQYYQNTKDRPPSPMLIRALNFVEKKKKALDLGAGALSESLFLVEQGFETVVAVDKEQIPNEFLNKIENKHFQFVCSLFEQFDFQRERFDLINARYALPFNSPESFPSIWNHIKESLVFGGVFVGQFFGVEDEWNVPGSNRTFHTRQQIDEMFADMSVIELKEENKIGLLADGSSKHWHVFHVIAKKKKL